MTLQRRHERGTVGRQRGAGVVDRAPGTRREVARPRERRGVRGGVVLRLRLHVGGVRGIRLLLLRRRVGDRGRDRVGEGVGVDRQQVRLTGSEVVVPEPHRVGLVEEGGDLLLLAARPQRGVGLERVGAGEEGCRDDDPLGSLRRGRDLVDAARQPGDRPGLAPGRGEHPQLPGLVVRVALGVRAGRDEQQITARREGRAALALGRAGQPPGRAAARCGNAPQRPLVARPVLLERRDGQDDRGAVR
jgi:hypothetical protein